MKKSQAEQIEFQKHVEKGQFVIPKEAREMFDLQPGSEILVLGDVNRGIAILPRAMQQDYITRIFSEMEDGEQKA